MLLTLEPGGFFFFFFLFNVTLQLSHSFLGAHIAKATPPPHDVYLLIIIPRALTRGRASCLVTMDTTKAKARAAQEEKGKDLLCLLQMALIIVFLWQSSNCIIIYH